MEVFVTSPWVPAEWIQAHGLEPRGAWFAAPSCAAAVPEGVCAFARAMVGLTGASRDCAFIFTTACDQMRRAADAVSSGGGPPVFLFNLPATWQTPAARRLYRAELARLGKFLEALGGRAPTDAVLAEAIRDQEQRRERLRRFVEQDPGRSGAEAMMACFDGRSAPAAAPSTSSKGPAERRSPAALARAACRNDSAVEAVPLALVGGPLLPAQWPLFDALESAGGRVVLNATEPGERHLPPPLPGIASGRNLLTALADHYFDHCVDVFQRPNTRLYDWLAARLRQRAVRGIVLWVRVGCDLWRAEAATLRETFSLPVLELEPQETDAGSPRHTNRLTAFVETLRTRPDAHGAQKERARQSTAGSPASAL